MSLKANRLTVQPTLNRASYAKFVAYQRQHSSDQINAMHSGHLVREVFSRFANQATPASPEFQDFIDSQIGNDVLNELWDTAPVFQTELSTEIEKILQLDQTFKTAAGKFSVNELIRFWTFLVTLSRCARFWQDRCSTPLDRSGVTVPIMSYESLEKLGASLLNLQQAEFAKYFRQFSTVPVPNMHPDLFYRPLVQLPDNRILLPLSYIETSRFPRNLITIAIKESDLDVAIRGVQLVTTLRRRLASAAFRVAENVRLVVNDRGITDIDILFSKERVLFVGQTKIVVQPDSAYEHWKAKQRLTHAAQQLSLSLTYLPYLPVEVQRQLDVKNVERIVPFLLTNAWDLTGTTINGYPVVDFSYLGFIADGAEVGLMVNAPVPRRTGAIRFIEGNVPSAKEMEKMLRNPIHEAMFDVPELIYLEVPFLDRVLVLPSSIHASQLPDLIQDEELT